MQKNRGMEMEWRRGRRFGGKEYGQRQSLLPLRHTHLSNTISCWYCDFKITAFNETLFSIGRKHARWLRFWFAVGMGFGLTTMLGVTMILLLELARGLHLYNGNLHFSSILSGSFFRFDSSFSGVSFLVAAVGYMCISSIIAVCAHEFGHALSAASEGIQMEYTAVFLAVLFPGALVALNHELLLELPRFATLRIYCAGIWHNAALCVVCALTLFLLPFILYPFYIHGESPMVMDVSSDSPLSGYLSTGDLIISLDGNRIHSVEEWTKMTGLLADQINDSKYHNGGKGYCIPASLIGGSKHMLFVDNHTTCGNELMLFEKIYCIDSSLLSDGRDEDDYQKRRENFHCVAPKDVLHLKKCGNGHVNRETTVNSCPCSEEESCLTPVKLPGLTWVEITYSSPYSPGCRELRRKLIPSNKNFANEGINCGGTFVFIGDLMSMANSVLLTSYQPRWSFIFGAYLPSILENLLMYTFHVSLMLALLNGLPVYFLDGESILEMSLCCFSFLTPRQREIILQSCLLGGTLVSILLILRIFLYVISVS